MLPVSIGNINEAITNAHDRQLTLDVIHCPRCSADSASCRTLTWTGGPRDAVVVNDTRRRRRDYCCATQPLGRGRAAREPVEPVEPIGVGGCATRGRCLGDTPGGGREPVRVPRPGRRPAHPDDPADAVAPPRRSSNGSWRRAMRRRWTMRTGVPRAGTSSRPTGGGDRANCQLIGSSRVDICVEINQ